MTLCIVCIKLIRNIYLNSVNVRLYIDTIIISRQFCMRIEWHHFSVVIHRCGDEFLSFLVEILEQLKGKVVNEFDQTDHRSTKA